ncbi:AMP-binding protein [Breznakiella homolactica]|uniref:AMP-binding protein n=1 Tax=Breznakiella homolactica TaxID=2798577 RepID=A0A7T7XM95_9SPIR|nr:AMP-binding protein [Breznakiella homolactica]QQO08935.1 AMP-binding protein [Breznakiella homolactica]
MIYLEKRTLPELALRAAAEFGQKQAFDFYGDQGLYNPISYGEFGRRTRQFARLLQDMGVQPGGRVMLFSENRPGWVIAYFGIALAGAVSVPVLTDFIPEHIKTISEHAEVSLIFATERTLHKISEAGIDSAIPVVRLDKITGDTITVLQNGSEQVQSLSEAGEFPSVKEEDLASILYTSGTTGSSKGVMLSHRNIVFDAQATRSIIKVFPRDRFLSIIPLAHTYECTIGMVVALLNGACTTYMDKPPSPAILVPAMQTLRPTFMLTVPLIIEKIYRSRIKPTLEAHILYKFPLTRRLAIRSAGRKLLATFGGAIRFFGIGGAALAPDVETFLKKAKFPYAIGYGLTETAPLLAGSAPFKTALRSTGPALAGVSLRLADQDGKIIAGTGAEKYSSKNREGEIQAKGLNVMMGYYKDEERTKEAFTPDGWFRTGDLGSFDRKRRLSIKGRSKAMILGPSGENIYPEEIEGILNASEFVEDSLVYPGDKGELVALIVLSEKAQTMIAALGDMISDLKNTVNKRLAAFSRINRIEVQDEPFEKTATKKIKRFLYPKKDGKDTEKS